MSENIFYTKFSEISGDRFDPQMVLYKKSTNSFRYDTVLFKDLLLSNPMYGANEAGIERTNKNEPRYIRITDIDEFGNLKDGLGVTAKVIENKYFLNEDDLLFARSGATVGKAYIHRKKNYDCFFAGYMIKFVVDSNKINPYFIFLYTQLDIYKKWIQAIQRAAGQPNINAEEYKSLPVPIPPKHIQQEIINKIQDAYKQKEQKEQEAQNKLDSIDIYLLNELGIKSFSNEKESLEDRVFFRKFSEISGDRLDSSFHSYKNTYYKYIVSKYKVYSFSKIIDDMQTGLPIRKDYRECDGQYPYYGANGIIGFMNEYTHFGQYLIIGQDGYIGNHYVVNCKFWASNHTWVIKIKDGININYIKYFLDVWKYDYLITGGVIPKITKNAVSSIQIPLPPIEIQNEIANYIQNLRDEAQALKNEAIQIFEDAKKEVEKIILDENKKC